MDKEIGGLGDGRDKHMTLYRRWEKKRVKTEVKQ